jgi:hypothetical protein
MFNLDDAISEWRQQLAARGLKTLDVLNELESHLREDVDQRTRSGLSVEQAFEAAVQQMGPGGVLKTEFEKVGKSQQRLRRNLKGICCGVLAGFIVLISSYSSFNLGPTFGAGVLFFFAVGFAAFSVWGWRYATQVEIGFANLTPGARQTLELAREEAPRMHHNFVGTEHVLLGLTRLDTGIVANVMKRLGVNRELVVREVEELVLDFPAQEAVANIPYTPRVKKALLLAAKEAQARKHDHIGSEDIFLGLVLEGSGIAARALKKLGVQIERTREAILKESAEHGYQG